MPNKKDLFSVILLFILAILLLRNLLQSGIYSSHDSEVHVARLAQFNQAIKEGQFPVRWLANWNFGYGYPTFVYSYSLPYYLGAFLKIFIPNFETIFKLLIFLSVLLSGVTFYIFARQLTAPLSALIGSVFYLTAPYRFADVYERGALGEAFVFIFLPLLFLSPHTILRSKTSLLRSKISLKRNKSLGFLITSLTVFAVITTHALTFLIFLLPAVFYSLLFLKGDFKKMKLYISAIVFGFLLAAFQWLPMVFEQKYIQLDQTYFNIFQGNFISTFQLLRIPHAGVNIGTGIQLGLAQVFIVLFTLVYILYLRISKRKTELLVVFLFLSVIIAAFLTTNLSREIWTDIKPLQTLIFPWRFLTYTTFATAFLASLLANNLTFKKSWLAFFFLIFLAIFPSRHYLKGYNWYSFSDNYYLRYADPLKLDNYYLPKGLTKNLELLPPDPVSIIEGDGQIKIIKKQSNQLQIAAHLKKNSKVQFHTLYFPGWELTIDGAKTAIITNTPHLEGIVTAEIPAGNHKAVLKFEETPLRRQGNFLTLASFLILLLLIAKYYSFGQFSKATKQVL